MGARIGKWWLNLGLVVASLIVLAAVLEIGLRFMPVRDAAHTRPVNDLNPAMRFHLLDRADQMGYFTVDLQPWFEAAHRKDGRRFEFEDDWHWNGRGHQTLCRALLAAPFFEGLAPKDAPVGR